MKILRVYHAGRDPQHRARERALVALGLDVKLVVPAQWHGPGSQDSLSPEPFEIIELPVLRSGDVNRHSYDEADVAAVVGRVEADLLDIHAEPVSIASRQWLAAAQRAGLPTVMYTAQNIDKRYPPPFCYYERAALRTTAGLYPCSRQAASVARGKGFSGPLRVVPLGHDERFFRPVTSIANDRGHPRKEIVLGMVGRLSPEKGTLDAVRCLANIRRSRPARLKVVGTGPDQHDLVRLARELGVAEHVELQSWASGDALAAAYRDFDILLVPSLATSRWVEQFGRVIVEAQASGTLVAAYKTGAIPEVAGKAALLVSPGDHKRLASEILRTLDDASEVERRRHLGLSHAARCSWHQVALAQSELYEQASVFALTSQNRKAIQTPKGLLATRQQRARARQEYGPTAATPTGSRPFALPVLRAGGPLSTILGLAIDLVVDLRDAAVFAFARARRL